VYLHDLFSSITLLLRIRPSSAIRFNHTLTSTYISCNSYISDSQKSLSPDVIIWRYLNRVLNRLRLNFHHLGYLASLLQRLMWQPTIALLTFDLTYHTSIIKLIVINPTRLFPARESGAYRGSLTLPSILINQTHHG